MKKLWVHSMIAALVLIALAGVRPAWATDMVTLLLPGGVFPTAHETYGIFYRPSDTLIMTVRVMGSDYERVERVRILARPKEASPFDSFQELAAASSRTGLSHDRGLDRPPTGAFYEINVPTRGACGTTDIVADTVYRGGRTIRSPAKRATVDCTPPTLRVDSPTSGQCVKLGDGFALRMTATDDIGIAQLTANFGVLGRYGPSGLERVPLRPMVTFTYSIEPRETDGHGPVTVQIEAFDWGGGRASTEFRIVLDGKVPPTIGMSHPNHRQRFSTLEPILVEGAARDPGCGLDRVEIRARPAGTRDPFRVLMTVRMFSLEGYRVTLPPETLAPGTWELRAAAFAKTGRTFGDAWFGREIEVFRPSPARTIPGIRPTIPGIRPTIPPCGILRLPPQPAPPRQP
jgi:hypothetical protein